MPKIRKVKRRQRFRYSLNRKRLNTKTKAMNVINWYVLNIFPILNHLNYLSNILLSNK